MLPAPWGGDRHKRPPADAPGHAGPRRRAGADRDHRLGASACGDDAERQDADEPAGDFPVEVTAAKFPPDQRLAQTSDLELEIENAGDEDVPDLAVTIFTGDQPSSGSFSVRSDQPGLADPNRPVWILENGFPKLVTPEVKDLDEALPAGAEAAQTNTFSPAAGRGARTSSGG